MLANFPAGFWTGAKKLANDHPGLQAVPILVYAAEEALYDLPSILSIGLSVENPGERRAIALAIAQEFDSRNINIFRGLKAAEVGSDNYVLLARAYLDVIAPKYQNVFLGFAQGVLSELKEVTSTNEINAFEAEILVRIAALPGVGPDVRKQALINAFDAAAKYANLIVIKSPYEGGGSPESFFEYSWYRKNHSDQHELADQIFLQIAYSAIKIGLFDVAESAIDCVEGVAEKVSALCSLGATSEDLHYYTAAEHFIQRAPSCDRKVLLQEVFERALDADHFYVAARISDYDEFTPKEQLDMKGLVVKRDGELPLKEKSILEERESPKKYAPLESESEVGRWLISEAADLRDWFTTFEISESVAQIRNELGDAGLILWSVKEESLALVLTAKGIEITEHYKPRQYQTVRLKDDVLKTLPDNVKGDILGYEAGAKEASSAFITLRQLESLIKAGMSNKLLREKIIKFKQPGHTGPGLGWVNAKESKNTKNVPKQ